MHRIPRAPILVLLLLAALLLVAGCGESDDSSADSSSATTPKASGDFAAELPDPGSTEAAEERLSGSSSFALTPEVSSCLETAGFATDAPPHGALAAWRHPGGARAFVATDSSAALEVASMAGSADAPAEVSGRVVVLGPQPLAKAAVDCLADA